MVAGLRGQDAGSIGRNSKMAPHDEAVGPERRHQPGEAHLRTDGADALFGGNLLVTYGSELRAAAITGA